MRMLEEWTLNTRPIPTCVSKLSPQAAVDAAMRLATSYFTGAVFEEAEVAIPLSMTSSSYL
jgi:hypothetical protein